MENKVEEKLDLVKEYEIENKKLVGYLVEVIKQLPICYFNQQVDVQSDKITIEVRKILTLTRKRSIVKEAENQYKIAENYTGTFAPRNSTLLLNLKGEDVKQLFDLAEARAAEYTQEKFVDEQNQVIVDLLKRVNKEFALSDSAEDYFNLNIATHLKS